MECTWNVHDWNIMWFSDSSIFQYRLSETPLPGGTTMGETKNLWPLLVGCRMPFTDLGSATCNSNCVTSKFNMVCGSNSIFYLHREVAFYRMFWFKTSITKYLVVCPIVRLDNAACWTQRHLTPPSPTLSHCTSVNQSGTLFQKHSENDIRVIGIEVSEIHYQMSVRIWTLPLHCVLSVPKMLFEMVSSTNIDNTIWSISPSPRQKIYRMQIKIFKIKMCLKYGTVNNENIVNKQKERLSNVCIFFHMKARESKPTL